MRRDVFQAIADPTRREIIGIIAHKTLNLNSIADNFDISRPAISKHIKILTQCGLLTVTQQGRDRYCKANFKKLNEVSDWVEQYRSFWTNKLDALGDFLEKDANETDKLETFKNQIDNMRAQPFVIEKTYNAPVYKVWEALTDRYKMEQWYFELANFKPEVGFEFSFIGGSEAKSYLHLCKITEVVPNKKLTYSWRYDEYPGESFVTFELFDEGNETRLKLTHTGLETFQTDNPDFAKESFAKGWTYIIGTSLKNYLEKE